MTLEKRLHNLKPIADLIKQRDLSDFASINRQRNAILARLSNLGDPPAALNDGSLAETVFAQTEKEHALWRTQRRQELNAKLARCQAEWLAKREMAERAFGRSTMIDRLEKQGRI